MAKGRWNKYRMVNKIILKILKDRPCSTNEVKEILKKNYNIRISWVTIKSYLDEMERMNHIEMMTGNKKGETQMWRIS